jgi:hypothetical protein
MGRPGQLYKYIYIYNTCINIYINIYVMCMYIHRNGFESKQCLILDIYIYLFVYLFIRMQKHDLGNPSTMFKCWSIQG